MHANIRDHLRAIHGVADENAQKEKNFLPLLSIFGSNTVGGPDVVSNDGMHSRSS